MLALCLDCSTAALATLQNVLPIGKLVELNMLDFSDHTRNGISILTSAADQNQYTIQANILDSVVNLDVEKVLF